MDKKKNKNILLALAAATGGLSAALIASHVAIYDSIFKRHERPDYALNPGLICIDRIDKKLPYEDVSFYSDDVLLKGRYFTCKKAKGIVIIAHGMKSGGDDYLSIANFFVKNNYNAFVFNYKGTYESEGDSTVGMLESLVDLDHAIDYICHDKKYKKLPIFLFGHSWGGFAVSSVLSIKNNIKACACVSAMNNAYTMILEKGSQYAGNLAASSKPFLDVYQKFLFKDYTNYTGVGGINSSNIPIVIAHGIDDKVIVIDKQSIVANKDSITNNKVKYYLGKGLQGEHTNIMFSNEALIYRKEIESELKLMQIMKGSELTYEEKASFYARVNHELYSKVNETLFALILKTFNDAL